MAAANTDKFRKKKSNYSSTLSSGIGAADASLGLASASGLATDTAITLTIDRVDTNGTSTPSKMERVTGVLSGTTLGSLVRGVEGTAQAHSAGAVVEDIWEAASWNDALTALLVSMNQDGTMISSLPLTTPKITTSINDANGNEVIKTPATASAVNEITITNAATGNGVSIASTGGDTNIALTIAGKGTGAVILGQATSTDVRLAADQPIADSSGNELIKFTKVASAVNEITLSNNATGSSPIISATGGDTNVGLDVKMKGTGKLRLPTIVEIMVVDPATDTSTGDAKAFFRVPEELNGMNLTGVAATVYTAGTTNTTDVQIRNKTQTADMLTTKLTIDSTETDTSTAATAAVIDTNNDDVATGDVIAIDIDAVSTTAAKGLLVQMRFELP